MFPVQPISPVNPVSPVMPFVLGTGSAPGGTSVGLEQGNSQVAQAYNQILAQYAGLYQRGMLDAQGLASWQQVWSSYQQIVG